MDFMSLRSSAPENPSRVGLDLLKYHSEVSGRRQGLVDVPFLVPVLEIQRPGFICLAVSGLGHVGLGPDGFVLPMGPLFEQGDGHSSGDVSDADLVSGVLRDKVYAIAVQMGLGFGPDCVGYGHTGLRGIWGDRVGVWGGESQGAA